MRIALVYPYLHQSGGIERYVWKLGAELAGDHDVTIVTGKAEGPPPPRCRVVSLPFVPRPWFLAHVTFALAGSLWLRRASFDVIHAHAASSFQPDVVTAHSCHKAWFTQSRAELPRWSRRWWLKVLNPLHYFTILIETIQYRRGGHRRVISVSTSVKRELMEHYGLADEDVVVIHSGVDTCEFDPERRAVARATVRGRHGIGADELLLLFVGNEFRRKGLITVLQALRSPGLAAARLLVAGKDDPAPYRAEAERLGVSERVIFAGPTGNPAELYASADVFVMPTRYEAFPLVILEAMASGLPVVTTRRAGAVEMIEDGVTGILVGDPLDPRAWIAALERLDSVALRASLGAAARARAEQFPWRRVADETVATFTSVLEERGGRDAQGLLRSSGAYETP